MSTTERATRIPHVESRRRIIEATRDLIAERSFAELTVRDVMAHAGLARTLFYRHFDALPDLAPELLPDSDDPLVAQVERLGEPGEMIEAMVSGLVDTFANHGRLLRAIDDAARHDADVAARLDTALAGPRDLIARLLAGVPNPPPDPEESARLLQASHRAYLLDTFGSGHDTALARKRAHGALMALWERICA